MPTSPNATAPATPATAATPGDAPKPAAPADTFRRLSPGALPENDARMLAAQSARPGVIGEAQAVRAARMAEQLPPDQRAQLQQAVGNAKSDTERAFIYKALAAGHPVSEVVDFAARINGLSDRDLLKDYTLSGPLGNQETPGLNQQFDTSCVPSVAETLRGDADPIYAKSVRSQNEDVNVNDPTVKNDALRSAEKQLLERTGGGQARPFPEGGGSPTRPNKVDDVLNTVSQYTGVRYRQTELPLTDAGRHSPGQERLIDQLEGQLRQGIATPFQVRTPDATRAHEALAIAVEGTGDQARFLVHDPATGDTAWVPRKELVWGANAFPDWAGYRYGLSGVALAQEQVQ